MTINTMFRTAATAAVLAGGLAAAAVPTSASATVTDPVLHAIVQSDYAAPCSYSANLQWERATDQLTGYATVQNHLWFEACRKTLVVTFVDDEGNVARVKSIALPTACATTDPTCPSGSNTPISELAGVSRYARPFIDRMDADIVGR
jgi:hypothetical protein